MVVTILYRYEGSPAASAQDLAAQIILEICRNDNFYLILGQRPVQNT